MKRRYPLWRCQRCAAQIGYLGWALSWMGLHRCKKKPVFDIDACQARQENYWGDAPSHTTNKEK